MALNRPIHRAVTSLLSASVGIAVIGAGLVVSPAQAVGAPSGLGVRNANSATPILTWNRATGTTYQVQVDNDSSFGSPEVNESTKNVKYVPTKNLAPGQQFWRVRAVKGESSSDWTRSSFSVAAVSVPVPTNPANGAVLPQPDQPPLLRWLTSRGAKQYTVEVDGDADFIGAKSYTTQSTSLAVPDALPAGDYYWRVTASLGDGFNSVPSATSRFDLGPLAVPTLVYPLDDIDGAIEDVVLDWNPVPGAQYYDLQVATDASFNNFAYKAENLRGSRFSPPVTLFNDQFWWRVRAIDLAGQATEWASGRASFQRSWVDKPVAQWPTGATSVADGSVPTSSGTRWFYQWSPVDHASSYEIQLADDPNFSVGVKMCETASTTYAPRDASDGCAWPAGDVHYWRVRPNDFPYPDGLPGVFSVAQKVKFDPLPNPGPETSMTFAFTSGLKASMTGLGAAGAGSGCVAVTCSALSATPVLSWNAYPGATSYQVILAVDENFTTSPLTDLGALTTKNTYFSLRWNNQVKALADSQAGEPWYWFVVPCNSTGCGPNPISESPPPPGAHSFVKASPAVVGLTSSDPAGSDITFSWQDYMATNNATATYGETGQQAARAYRIQVDNEPSFQSPLLEEAVVDQTTFTSRDKLYPEGAVWWRVQAIDAQENNLTWSEPAPLIKASPALTLTSPASGATVPGSTPFEWAPQGHASAYEVEVYKNGDVAFSPANRVVSGRVANPSYTPASPLPASNTPYVWRVRRFDSTNNPGPWSSAYFTSLGSVPELLTPGNGPLLPSNGAFFEWSDVPGAARYQLTLISPSGGKVDVNTVGTAHAPSELTSGNWTWSVAAFDAADKPLGSSQSRGFRIDAIQPKVVKVKPGKPNATSDLKVLFSERVKGISKKTVKLKRANAKGKLTVVKAKVKVKKAGKLAIINPKGRLKKGTYVIVFKNTAIKDLAGNPLVDKKINAPSP